MCSSRFSWLLLLGRRLGESDAWDLRLSECLFTTSSYHGGDLLDTHSVLVATGWNSVRHRSHTGEKRNATVNQLTNRMHHPLGFGGGQAVELASVAVGREDMNTSRHW